MHTRAAFAAAAALVGAVLLAACDGAGEALGGGGPTSLGPTSRATATESESRATPGGSPSPYLPVPRGVVLTDPGSELGVGEKATIAWRPRDGEVSVLAVRVRKLVKSDIKVLSDWQLDPAGRSSALYYVAVTVANVGDGDLSGQRIPLYVVDGTGALVESSEFKTDFDPCASRDLPAGFVTGEKATMCQAYLVPEDGELKAVAFRATPKFNPIRWVGKVTEAQ